MTARYPNTPKPPPTVMETTVFQSGNSQAVRIPKEFQIDAARVEILRDGQRLVLRPVARSAADALGDLPPLSEAEAQALDDAMARLDDLLPLDEPDAAPKAAPASRRRSAR